MKTSNQIMSVYAQTLWIKQEQKFKHVYWTFTICTYYLVGNLDLDTIPPTQLYRQL